MNEKITHPYQGHYMQDAFESFCDFARQDLLGQYISECGMPEIGTSPIDRMIDDATGKSLHEAQKFVDWCVVQFGHPDDLEQEKAG